MRQFSDQILHWMMLGARALALAWYLARGFIFLALRLVRNRLRRKSEVSKSESIVGRTLAEFLIVLGPTYIKLGQILSTRRDLFGEPVIQTLEKLRDCLPPSPFHVVPLLFRKELGVGLEDAFSEFETPPIASASIADVYRARLYDGRVVAVKVRRPGIQGRIEIDLRLLELVINLLNRIPPLRLLPLRPAFDEVRTCLERQLDFRLEVAANKRLRAALVWEPEVYIPTLVDELCSSSIITMDFVDGIHSPSEVGKEMSCKALRTALRALYRMIFVEGLIHCDMHQGNMCFLADGRVVLLDFGFVAEFKRADRLMFAEFFYAMAINDGIRCAEITVEAASFIPPDLAYDRFEAEVVALVDRVSGARACDFQVTTFVAHLFDIQRRFRIVGTTAFTMAIISLLVFEGISKDVDADLDFQSEAHPFILRASIQPLPRERFDINTESLDVVSLKARFYPVDTN